MALSKLNDPRWPSRAAALLCWLAVCATCSRTHAQGDVPPDTIGSSAFAGVAVDADGVLKRVVKTDPTGQLMQTRVEQSRVALGADLSKPSKLRKISLTRLIAQV